MKKAVYISIAVLSALYGLFLLFAVLTFGTGDWKQWLNLVIPVIPFAFAVKQLVYPSQNSILKLVLVVSFAVMLAFLIKGFFLE
jgi:hypothetical protein